MAQVCLEVTHTSLWPLWTLTVIMEPFYHSIRDHGTTVLSDLLWYRNCSITVIVIMEPLLCHSHCDHGAVSVIATVIMGPRRFHHNSYGVVLSRSWPISENLVSFMSTVWMAQVYLEVAHTSLWPLWTLTVIMEPFYHSISDHGTTVRSHLLRYRNCSITVTVIMELLFYQISVIATVIMGPRFYHISYGAVLSRSWPI